MTNPVTGAGYFFTGLSLIFKPKIRRFVIIPFIINILVFVIMFAVLGSYFGGLVDQLMTYFQEQISWFHWISWLLWILFFLLAAIVMFFTFSMVANIIGAPFNSYLAAAVEEKLTGKRPPDSPASVLAEAGKAILGEAKKWLYYLMWVIPLLIVSFVVAPLAPVLWFLFGSWMYSIEYSDYPLGNYGLTFPEIRRKLSEKRFLSLGFGGTVTIATLIPVFNFLVMPISVAGATAMRVNEYPMQLPEAQGQGTSNE